MARMSVNKILSILYNCTGIYQPDVNVFKFTHNNQHIFTPNGLTHNNRDILFH